MEATWRSTTGQSTESLIVTRFSHASRFRDRKRKGNENPNRKRLERTTNQSRFQIKRATHDGVVDGGFGGAAWKVSLSLAVDDNGFPFDFISLLLKLRFIILPLLPSPLTPITSSSSPLFPVDVSCRHSRRRSACEFAQFLSGYSQAALSIC